MSLLVSGKNNVTMNASGFKIKNSECEKTDCGLVFENYLDGVNKKAGSKISASSRVTAFLNFPNQKMLLIFFFNLQFSYYPQVWIITGG